ncbi:MAG: alpha/beta fold hydrolase [Pyrinomonadaceae bacterium]
MNAHTLVKLDDTFHPSRFLRNSHAQTIVTSLLPRRRAKLAAQHDEARLFTVADGVQILAWCRWQPSREKSPTVLLVHGLEGSSESPYMLGLAAKTFRHGFNAVRLNMRSCGGTEHLTPTLYNSGLSADVSVVVDELITRDGLEKMFLAGVSMGGNIVLKLAGEYGDDAPKQLLAVAVVSPSIDLSACIDAIEARSNWIYQEYFLRRLRRSIRRKHRLFPNRYDRKNLLRIRTLRDFDARFTCPDGGFTDTDDYYTRASSLPFMARIKTPTIIIHAQDDPFIPYASLLHPTIAANFFIRLLTPSHGGHGGFLSDKSKHPRDADAYWAENRIVEFFESL